ncbi:MAG: dTDP-glucose 4,6-dehydratase [Bdellovibrionaceae bacterium]|nr:dTDP-glucose 4,6-dehydratase [Pseudobdellovibrionaceae bacterium]
MKKNILLTGCAGFIGSNFVKKIACDHQIKETFNFTILDALTYAGRKQTLEPELEQNKNLRFVQIDIRDNNRVQNLFNELPFDGVIHFAAESHVDRSITNPNIFVETNVLGTLNLLNASLPLFNRNPEFRFVHVSTDEVYGTLSESDPAFTEETPLAPNSPYSASKAGSDLLVRSYFETYKLNAITTRCSNNYGPYQFPEKLIPLMIQNALNNKKLPVYGDGRNIRDWIFVDDHNRGIWQSFLKGKAGEVYNFGGNSEKRNIDVVRHILKTLNKPESLIQFVEDRKGHDWRYAIDYSKAQKDLNWNPTVSFETGLEKTIEWYLKNNAWIQMIESTRT